MCLLVFLSSKHCKINIITANGKEKQYIFHPFALPYQINMRIFAKHKQYYYDKAF